MNKYLDKRIISLALNEDLGKQDLTGTLISKKKLAQGKIIARQQMIICGIDWANAVFTKVDPEIKIRWTVHDGDKIKNGLTLCTIEGKATSILMAERTVLNFLQTLSSTATLTRQWMKKLKGTNVKLLDTRKTLPGLRKAQKYAVTCGGGTNHRFGLFDAVLIKENHIAAIGSITEAVAMAYNKHPKKLIEIEVRNLEELLEAINTEAKVIMLDNFSFAKIKQAVKLNRGKKQLEVSGGVNLKNIRQLAETGVDYISVGTITKTVIPIDLSLLFDSC